MTADTPVHFFERPGILPDTMIDRIDGLDTGANGGCALPARMHYARTVYAYHGCSASTAEAVLAGGEFKASSNPYDWLGGGIYFWEYGLARAWNWAKTAHGEQAAVVGAHIHLGDCFDLLDVRFAQILKALAPIYVDKTKAGKGAVPANKGPELKARFFDCALLNWALGYLQEEGQRYQSVRCAFIEGEPIYDDGSGGRAQIFLESHIQIAVRDRPCILGTFTPRGALSDTSR